MNLDDDRILKLLFTKKWNYRSKKDKQNSKDFQNSFKKFFNRIVGRKIMNELLIITDKYSNYINFVKFGDVYKKIFAKRLYRVLRLRFILSKFIVDNDTEFKKKYIRSSFMKKWNDKCKELRRKRNGFMKIRRILKIHSRKVLIITFKLKKFKLHFLTYAMMKRNNNHNVSSNK